MSVLRNILTLLFILNTFFNCNAQTKKELVNNAINWKAIRIIEIDSVGSIPKKYDSCGGGENVFDWHKKFRTITDLSKKQLKKIKRYVAKNGGQIVYIDIHNIVWPEDGFYIVWFDCQKL